MSSLDALGIIKFQVLNMKEKLMKLCRGMSKAKSVSLGKNLRNLILLVTVEVGKTNAKDY